MLLTGFDVKKYEDTIREEGFTEGAASRQKEVDELNETIKGKDEEIAEKDAELDRLYKQIEELKRKTS